MDDSQIERALTEAQAAMKVADSLRIQRQRAVMDARAAGWSKYKIGQVLGVGVPTINSIIASAQREHEAESA